jgi:hypothetical protein
MSFPHRVLQTISNLWRGGPREFGSDIIYPIGMSVDMWGAGDVIRDYCEIPEINAVYNMKASMFSAGTLKLLDKKGKDASSKHPELATILETPNWFQDQKEFMVQTKLFHEILGNEFIYNLFPLGMKAERSSGLFSLPPNLVKVEFKSDKLFFTVSDPSGLIKYTWRSNGKDVPLPADAMMHFNDSRVKYDESIPDEEILRGVSKLEALRPVRQNLRLAYESLGVILKNRGALGIISNDSDNGVGQAIPIKDDEKKIIQDGYRNYGGLSHQNQLIITSAKVKWQQMSVNPDKLGLFQGKKEDFAKVLDSAGMAMELFVNQGSTYENQKQARKGTYQETIIPEALKWVGGLNRKLLSDSYDKIVVDYSHLPIFQEDLKSKGEAYKAMADALNRMLVDGAIDVPTYIQEIETAGITRVSTYEQPVKPASTEDIQLAQAVQTIQYSVKNGTIDREAGLATLTNILHITPEIAGALLPEVVEEQPIDNGQNEETEGGNPPGGEPDQGSGDAA